MTLIDARIECVRSLESRAIVGRVEALRGMTIVVQDLPLAVGSLVRIEQRTRSSSRDDGLGEVVGFDGERTIVMMLGSSTGVGARDRVAGLLASRTIDVSDEMLSRCIDGLGRPIDGNGPIAGGEPRPLEPAPVSAMTRERIREPLVTGVRAVDLMTPIGRGQRIGIFSGPGVGKSTLLANMARHGMADVNVIALVGERGREVREFIEESLGNEGLRRSVVVVATSDESPLLRIRAAQAACSVAEHFRDRGAHVLLMVDSITRFAHAQRQVGLSVGEPPATRGYTPSVFASMARLLERAGIWTNGGGPTGSVTGVYSILVEGDDMSEPVSDTARGVLDGHITLSRALARRGHFPAIDVLDSISRVAGDVIDSTHAAARRQLLGLMSAYTEIEELHRIGAYVAGSSPEADTAIEYRRVIDDLLRQESGEEEPFDEVKSRMIRIAMEAGGKLAERIRG